MLLQCHCTTSLCCNTICMLCHTHPISSNVIGLWVLLGACHTKQFCFFFFLIDLWGFLAMRNHSVENAKQCAKICTAWPMIQQFWGTTCMTSELRAELKRTERILRKCVVTHRDHLVQVMGMHRRMSSPFLNGRGRIKNSQKRELMLARFLLGGFQIRFFWLFRMAIFRKIIAKHVIKQRVCKWQVSDAFDCWHVEAFNIFGCRTIRMGRDGINMFQMSRIVISEISRKSWCQHPKTRWTRGARQLIKTESGTWRRAGWTSLEGQTTIRALTEWFRHGERQRNDGWKQKKSENLVKE